VSTPTTTDRCPLCEDPEVLNCPVCQPRYYVAAVQFGWAIFDITRPRDAGPTGPHFRVWYRTPDEQTDFAGVHVIAKAECKRLNDEVRG
jgi:hypothetical protein